MMSSGSGTLFLLLDAPFAAFRWLQAGVFRGTFPVIPPSAAWGLALNLAGIETRGNRNEVVTPIRSDAPHLDIAVGLVASGERSLLYQQLHGYPVGNSGGALQARAHGQKFWIAPVRREVIVGLRCVVGVRGDEKVVDQIPKGLSGALEGERYGLPFAGDNQFLFNQIDVIVPPVDVRWYVPVQPGATPRESTRLTTVIDRGDASRTATPLFAPTSLPCACPPQAWVDVGPRAAARSA